MNVFVKGYNWLKDLFSLKKRRPIHDLKVGFAFPFSNNTDLEDEFYYDDDYFLGDGSKYNPSLATASMALAMASFSSNLLRKDLAKQNVNLVSLFNSLRFTKPYYSEDYFKDTRVGGIAYGIANKKVKNKGEKYTLIAIGVRGANYGKEWASNFYLGDEPEHAGFKQAASRIYEDVDNYIADNKIKGPIKFWISGFSRGGGVSNVLAFLLDNYQAYLPKKSSLAGMFAYCFAAPKGGVSNSMNNKGIYNIINPNDSIPKVAFGEWGYIRYGEDHYLPYIGDENFEYSVQKADKFVHPAYKYAEPFHFLHVKIINIFRKGKRVEKINQDKEHNQATFLDSVEKFFTKSFNKDEYVKELQDGVMEMFTLVDPKKEDPYSDLMKFFISIKEAIFASNSKLSLVRKALSSSTEWDKELLPLLERICTSLRIKLDCHKMAKMVGPIASTIKKDITRNIDFYTTFGNPDNLKALLAAHDPIIYFAFIKAEDPKYK
ncbi:MAG: hypothetical protein K5694_01780 [Bacilli bacterium]|nr:hypothetical protein [Bacilli bacterium]